MEDIRSKCFKFSLRIIKIYKFIEDDSVGRIIGKQLLRSGTSIGANLEEAFAGQSPKDFIHKFTLAQKEACETKYWLRLLEESEIVSSSKLKDIISEIDELTKIIAKSIITAKEHK